MEIQTVKIENNEGDFRVNGTMIVPPSLDNADYVKVAAWIAEGNTPAPQYTDSEIAANTQAETNATSQAYLDSTDWYITRHAETGVAVPDEITTARASARAAIV
jgi:hypothetical protein